MSHSFLACLRRIYAWMFVDVKTCFEFSHLSSCLIHFLLLIIQIQYEKYYLYLLKFKKPLWAFELWDVIRFVPFLLVYKYHCSFSILYVTPAFGFETSQHALIETLTLLIICRQIKHDFGSILNTVNINKIDRKKLVSEIW